MLGTHKLSRALIAVFLLAGLLALSSPLSTLHAQMGGGMGNGMGNSQTNMGNGMGGMMLTSGGAPYRLDRRTVQMDDAINIASRYMDTLSSAGLALDEIEEWEYNYYVVVKEAPPSPYKAYQLLIDKWTGFVMPEPGPNMMWNQKYGGMMNSMMDGMPGHMNKRERRITDPKMTVTLDAAASAASQFLRERFSHPLVVAEPPDTFYGYYNFDVNDAATGIKYGMLSVNGTTGQVWYHTWHGGFLQGKEVD